MECWPKNPKITSVFLGTIFAFVLLTFNYGQSYQKAQSVRASEADLVFDRIMHLWHHTAHYIDLLAGEPAGFSRAVI
jgi:hypothetical protein